jgi:L-fuconolactonase
MSRAMTDRIDAHQHFWHYSQSEYDWIDASMASLQHDLLPQDLAPELATAKVDGVLTVQARQTIEETRWLLQMADQFEWIRGVIGWAEIAGENFCEELEILTSNEHLKGLRHVVQAEQDPKFLLRDAFFSGIRALQGTSLVYDLLIVEHQLPNAIEFVRQHPNQLFVLDHIAKPKIAAGLLEPWRTNLRILAKQQNVYCKLSGMVTEAAWDRWRIEDLRPYADVVLETFGPRRLMIGSDWPVCTVGTSYSRWFSTLESLLQSLSQSERERVFGGTAIEAYRLI